MPFIEASRAWLAIEGLGVTTNNKKRLTVTCLLLALWAFPTYAARIDDIRQRIEPVAKVCVQGKPCEGVVTSTAVSSAGGGARDPADIITKHCNACHGAGLLDAPKIGDNAAWKKRADEQGGVDGLLAKAISGVNAMPPKGTCTDCTDSDLKAAIKQMSGL